MQIEPKYKILQDQITIQDWNMRPAEILLTDVERLMTKRDVADFFQVTVAAVSAWITQGKMQPLKVGRLTRFSKAEVVRALERFNQKSRRIQPPSITHQKCDLAYKVRARNSILRLVHAGEWFEEDEHSSGTLD